MSGTRRVLLACAIAFQLAVVGGMVAIKQLTVVTGKRIVIQTMQYDPRDMFRGDYAQLQFEFNRVELEGSGPYSRGGAIYVKLAQTGTVWTVSGYTSVVPSGLGANEVALRGVVKSSSTWGRRTQVSMRDESNPGWLAKQPEGARWRKEVLVIGSVDHEPSSTMYVTLKRYPIREPGNAWHVTDRSTTRPVVLAPPETGGYAKAKPAGAKARKGKKEPAEPEVVLVSVLYGSAVEKTNIEATYGIESYFIPEGRSGDYWGVLYAEVFVDRRGEGVLKSVFPARPRR